MEDALDDAPILSGAAFAALQDFYTDRDTREKQFEDLKAAAEEKHASGKPLSMDAFAENWNESQFWYSQDTASKLAMQLLAGATKETTIAVISAPSAFVQLKNILAESRVPEEERPTIYLLEFDKRFGVFDEFIFYDFNSPFKLPVSMKGSVDRIICDPPFLSEDCQTKAAMTVRWMSKSWGASKVDPVQDTKLIVCTGERMGKLVNRLYKPQGMFTSTFEPVHAKGLSNEFYCYANFECNDWKRR